MDVLHKRSFSEERQTERPLLVQVVRQFIPNRGGLEDVTANLGRQMVARGLRVRVVTLDRLFKDAATRLAPHEMIDGMEVVRIPWHGSSRYPFAPTVFSHLADADLVHVHGIDFFYDALALGWPLHRRPMVVTTHGGFFHTPKYARIKQLWFRTLTRGSASAYRAVITCSEADQALFSAILPRKSVMIENGVDIAKFAGASSQGPTRRIATIGRFSVNKRLDRLFDMLAALLSRAPEWALDVIGTPNEVSESDVRAMIAARRLDGQVVLHIQPDEAELARLLGSASFFASASEYEGFGLAAIEAMSAGLVPVLHANAAYRTLGGRHDGVAVTDFSKPDAAAVAVIEAEQRLLADPHSLRGAMIAASRAYSWQGVAERYAQVYRRAVPGLAVGGAFAPEIAEPGR